MTIQGFGSAPFKSSWLIKTKVTSLTGAAYGDIDFADSVFLLNWLFAATPTNNSLVYDYQTRDTSAIVSMYQADLTSIGGPIYYFTNERNEKLENPTWQGQVYTVYPIEITGFELRGNGQFPRPILKLSNYAAVMSGLAKQYADLVGVKITRKRTRLKYLDAVNFTNGNVSADPNTYFPDDIFYVNRKTSEQRLYVEWELTSALDISGIRLPRRQIIQNTCPWKYRSAECSYAGGAVADIHDITTVDLALDKCGKRLSSCKLRFPGTNAILPYGGFPGASMV